MPQLTERNVRHLLRRTEFVDRRSRVTHLMGLGSFEQAVDDVLSTPTTAPSVVFVNSADQDWRRTQELAHFWLNQMANDSARPMQEKMALFWHGHLVSEAGKVNSAVLMREQIDLYRREGLSNLRAMVKTMSTQVAMLRYLDNNENRAGSPNQNFARELMELFLLEVGNYTEADVEAATAAWTGHSDNWQTGEYRWRPTHHDGSIKQFLGVAINNGGDPRQHGYETIDVILGNGVVPSSAANAQHRGRWTREVAAEFLSRKLWIDFADQNPPVAVITAMRNSLIGSDFDIRPWVRTMLLRDEFYADAVLNGLVRSPIDWTVSILHALDLRSENATPMWLMAGTGQEILRPPNVSGWRTNGYYVNASAMEARARIAQSFVWKVQQGYWDDGGSLRFRHGSMTRADIVASSDWPDYVPTISAAVLVDTMASLMDVRLTAGSRQQLIAHAAAGTRWERQDMVLMILLAPELHLA